MHSICLHQLRPSFLHRQCILWKGNSWLFFTRSSASFREPVLSPSMRICAASSDSLLQKLISLCSCFHKCLRLIRVLSKIVVICNDNRCVVVKYRIDIRECKIVAVYTFSSALIPPQPWNTQMASVCSVGAAGSSVISLGIRVTWLKSPPSPFKHFPA